MTVIPYRASPDWPPVAAASVVVTDLLGERSERVSAKIDTGSFMTIVPRRLLERIQANRTNRERGCAGYDGQVMSWPVFIVTLAIADPRWPDDVTLSFEAIDVLGVDGPAEVLLGRDVLSAWHLHLDGRSSHYTVT